MEGQEPAIRDTPRPDAQVVPRFVPYSGRLITPDGTPLTGVVGVTLVFHRSQDDVAALWTETQRLELNADGRFTAILGSTSVEGLPLDLFSSGEPRWLAVHAAGALDPPQVLLASVPYHRLVGNAPPRALTEVVLDTRRRDLLHETGGPGHSLPDERSANRR